MFERPRSVTRRRRSSIVNRSFIAGFTASGLFGLMVIKIAHLLFEVLHVTHSNAVAFSWVCVQVDRAGRWALDSVIDIEEELSSLRIT